ncbi:MAG: DEAD/DEAH box helicase, partial [Planctomycetota bacterium]
MKWFASRGWTPFAFQREVWQAIMRGESGLLHAPTGTGKTYALWMGLLLEMMASGTLKPGTQRLPLSVLWITPL